MSNLVWAVLIVVALAVFIYLGFVATRKKAHHLDSLHISPEKTDDEDVES